MNYKNKLQEYCVHQGLPTPSYRTTQTGGEAHDPIWTVSIKIGSAIYKFTQPGSKTSVEISAAKKIYKKITRSNVESDSESNSNSNVGISTDDEKTTSLANIIIFDTETIALPENPPRGSTIIVLGIQTAETSAKLEKGPLKLEYVKNETLLALRIAYICGQNPHVKITIYSKNPLVSELDRLAPNCVVYTKYQS